MNNIEEFYGAEFGDFLLKSNLVASGKEIVLRHHVSDSALQRAVKVALRKAGIRNSK